MKLLKISRRSPLYFKAFYAGRPGLAESPYAEQMSALDHDACGWADFWKIALERIGYEVVELIVNNEPLQRAWARENGLSGHAGTGLSEIALEQIRRFAPEVLWFNLYDDELLRHIRSTVPSIRLVLGGVGSAVPQTDVWRYTDLVLTCAPETVDLLRESGVRAELLHHAFDPRINGRLEDREKTTDLTFVGNLIRAAGFHLVREKILEKVFGDIPGRIYSPSADLRLVDDIKAVIGMGVYNTMHTLKMLRVPEEAIAALPVVGRALRWSGRPMRPVNPKLKAMIHPGVFGLRMFQTLRDSRIVLNIHADSSPSHASNMRLFETTGVGTCLLTDFRENIHRFFEPETEVVTYRSADECLEKARWLLAHPAKRDEIAAAGHKRCLRDHTFAARVHDLDRIIKREFTSHVAR